MIDNLFDPSSKWFYPVRILILFFLGLAIYYQTFFFGFVFDDKIFIVNNDFIKHIKDIHHMWMTYPKTRLIGFYSFALNYSISQLDAKSYHVFNFIIHLISTGLVWILARTLFKITGWLSSDDKFREELAFIIALIFLAHPGQTQAVTYISQRFESMAAMFYFASIYCYLQGRIAAINTQKMSFFALSVCFAVLGILAKETAATIPAMIFAAELILFDRKFLNFKKLPSGQFYFLITMLGVLFVFLFMKIVRLNLIDAYFHVSQPSESHDGEMITGGNYLLTQMRVFLTFLRLLVLPINQNLDYDYPLSTGLLNPPMTLVGFCLIGFMAFLVFRLRKQWPLIAFGLAWILITFSINTAPRNNVIFEHKLYLISFGFILATVCFLTAIIKDRKVLLGLLITLLAVLSLACYKRNQVWKDDLTLWEDVVRHSPHKARPYVNRGLAFEKEGDLDQAMADFRNGIKINPNYPQPYIFLGDIYQKQGKYTQALVEYTKALIIKPDFAMAWYDRGMLYNKSHHYLSAIANLTKTIEIEPYNADAFMNRGVAYMAQGKFSQAIADFNKCIEIDPSNFDAYGDLGVTYGKMGNLNRAITEFDKALEINPNFTDAYNNRVFAYSLLIKMQAHKNQAL